MTGKSELQFNGLTESPQIISTVLKDDGAIPNSRFPLLDLRTQHF